MSEFVLEILSGDQAGDVIPLSTDTLVMGRRADCGLVLKDEKASGHHAEIAFEDGQHVLRDRGSTNGTLMDGRKVGEVVLTAFDVFVLGRVRIVYREASAAAMAGGPEVRTVDEAMLAQSGRRGGGGVVGLLVVLLLAAAGGAWFAWGRGGGDAAAPGARRAAAPARVPGNKLAQNLAACEAVGPWNLRSSGSGYELSGPARTGASALEAVRADDGPDAPDHAIATAKKAISVLPGDTLQLRAWMKTDGAGRGALRLRFYSSAGGGGVLHAGTTPRSFDAYTAVALDVTVPPGVDQADIELVALLPAVNAGVLVDDLALVAGEGAVGFDLRSGGRELVATRNDLLVRSADGLAVAGIRPAVTPHLRGLDAAERVALSDAGIALQVVEVAGAFTVSLSGAEPVTEFTLEFTEETAAAGVLVSTDGERFASQSGAFTAAGVRELLLGSGATRVLVRAAGDVQTTKRGDRYLLTLRGADEFVLVTNFQAEQRTARAALRDAEAQSAAGQQGRALEAYRRVVEELPHDDALSSEAGRRRAELLSRLERRLDELRAELSTAQFFKARGGFKHVVQQIDALTEGYGAEQIPDAPVVAKMRADAAAGLAALDAAENEERRKDLTGLAEVFARGGQAELEKLVRGYIQRHHAEGK